MKIPAWKGSIYMVKREASLTDRQMAGAGGAVISSLRRCDLGSMGSNPLARVGCFS